MTTAGECYANGHAFFDITRSKSDGEFLLLMCPKCGEVRMFHLLFGEDGSYKVFPSEGPPTYNGKPVEQAED